MLMALKVKCTCGKSYQVPDDAAGRRLKCKACGQELFVPEPPTEEFPLDSAATCPKCSAPMRPGAGFCTACGANLRTGAPQKPAAPRVRAGTRPHRAIVLPWGRIVGAAALLGVVAAVWFGALRPMRARSAIDDAMVPATEARYRTSVQMLKAAGGKLYGAYAEEANFRIAQLSMEMDYSMAGSSPDGDSIQIDAEPEMAKSGEMLLHLTVANGGQRPLLLRRRAFYLVSGAGMVLSTPHSEGSIDGVSVAPGATGTGVVAFRKLPGSPLGFISSEIVKPQTLVYNDGTAYTSTRFLMVGAGGPLGGDLPMP